MLKEIMENQNLTVYALAKKSGIPYMTLKDLISGKTSMEHVSAAVLYKLSVCLKVSMEDLYLGKEEEKIIYLYNRGRDVYVVCDKIRIHYRGPENLIVFHRVNRFCEGCAYVDTWFEDEDGTIYAEEDYIDLEDLFEEYNYDTEILKYARVKAGLPDRPQREKLTDEALLVSDYMAILYDQNSTEDTQLLIVNITRPGSKMLLRLKDYAVLSTNMSEVMQKRAIASVKRNSEMILTEIEERMQYA